MSEIKKFNTPDYINIPFFLYKDKSLERSELLLAGFLYSLHTSGKKIRVSNEYLSQMLTIDKRNVRETLSSLEIKKYITRIGKTSSRQIVWNYIPNSRIKYQDDSEIDARDAVVPSGQELVNRDERIPQLGMHASSHWGRTHPPYIKEDTKENNKDTTTSSSSNFFENHKENEIAVLTKVNEQFSKQQMELKFKNESLADEQCQKIFNERFYGLPITLVELYEECVDYWSQKNQMVYKARFLSHLKKSPIDKYKEHTAIKSKSSITPEDKHLIQNYCSLIQGNRKPDAEFMNKLTLLMARLKQTDTSEAREALVAIRKAEERKESKSYDSLVQQAVIHSVQLSAAGRSSLQACKDILR